MHPTIPIFALFTLGSTLCMAGDMSDYGEATDSTQAIRTIPTDEKLVCLTFDDGPHPANDTSLMDLFKAEGATATFFVIGKHVERHPDVVRRMAAEGHDVGNHTWSHPHLSKLETKAEVAQEIDQGHEIIEKILHQPCIYFRAPFFEFDDRAWAVIAGYHYLSFNSSVTTRDWASDVTAEEIIEQTSKAEAGDIILMHSFQKQTVKAMPTILVALKAKGLRCVSLSELLASKKNTDG